MISDKMKSLVEGSSAVRAMFDEGNRLKAIYGEKNVFDFSIGNPNVPAPASVRKAILEILEEEDPVRLHGYMPNAGFPSTRKAIAESLNRRFGTSFRTENIVMQVGAAGGMNTALKTVLNPGEDVITFAPYFMEYRSYVSNFDGNLLAVPPDTETFQPNLAALEGMITPKTRAVIINTPHNPTGVVYSEETLKRLAEILTRKQEENGSPIFLISDEPYRELVYGGREVPYVTKYYPNTIVCYSYSKALSLPGERIGYLVIPDEMEDFENVIAAAGIATRISGAVNAPSLMQLVVERCVDEKSDIEFYRKNRDDLYGGLTKLGFTCVEPEGAFYLWMKTPEPDDGAFCERAKKYHILMVAGSAFDCPGYVRLAYCVSNETIRNSLPAFAKLAAEYGL